MRVGRAVGTAGPKSSRPSIRRSLFPMKLRSVFKISGGIAAAVLVVVAIVAINTVWFRPWSVRAFFERVFIEQALTDPEMLSTLGILEQFGLRGHNAKLTDASVEYTQKALARGRRDLELLREYDRSRMSGQNQLSARILEWFLQVHAEGERFAFHDYPVNQFQGIQSNLPEFLTTIHRLQDRRDAEDYLRRLEAVPVKWDQLLGSLKYREDRGILPPHFVVERVLKEMRDFVAKPPTNSPLVTVFAERLAKVPELDPGIRLELQARAAVAVEQHVYPAYRKLIDHFAALEPRTTTDDGVWKLPDGDAYYAWALHEETTSRLTPAEVHALGLSEVARIEAEMRAILDSQGHTGGTPAEWYQRFAKDGRFLYPNTDEGRKQALDEYQRLIREVLTLAPKYFNVLPKAGVEVQRVPAFKEATAPGGYYNMPAMDGSRPGIFYANLRDMAEVPKYTMKTLTYHEGVPGHHFQIAIAMELAGFPTFRKLGMFNAYAEGWALYAERLAKEIGLYEGDPYGDLGRLQDEMLRAVRLVVDTGIHYKRWTRQQAIEYMVAKTGMPEPSVVSEIERYIVAPGQACGYKVGMLKILELRERAKQDLGPQFDLRAFHDVVLKNGAVPLDTLEELVNEWIESARKGRAA